MPIDQTRPFDQRLGEFGPELGAFLRKVWDARAQIDLKSRRRGVGAIYGLYSGADKSRAFDETELTLFIRNLTDAANGNAIMCQGLGRALGDLKDSEIEVYGQDLWTEFYHVLSSPRPAQKISARVYVHAADAKASTTLMTAIVAQFGINKGLWEAKTVGPGALRLDTIVCYLYSPQDADALVGTLQSVAGKNPELFVDSLPPLVKRVGAGIGVADEPPAIEIYTGGGARHSFGSFFSTLCWIALRGVPNLSTPQADGRHLLDNMLHALRLLKVEPKNPQRFPEARALETWYRGSLNKT